MRPRLAASFFLLTLAATAAAQEPPVPPDRAVSLMKLPDGFRATLFAGEPDLIKPIAMTTDDRGRLWVVESHSYPNWITDGSPGHDRVLIFEDRKGSGHFDSCTVFLDRGTNLSGIALGFGGVWLCSTPNLLFVPVNPGEDRPAGPPRVVLDGWDLKAKHNVFNSLTWGPDGWLYGCNGILSHAQIGAPGTPEPQRVSMDCGVWRYHPTKHTVEAFAHGTTNPWGLDFDERGEMFITNCVIKHLWHVIPGAHFQRMYGDDLDPNVYGLMESCADHLHWGGGAWTTSRGGLGAHSEAGGGHAHVGCMVYLGDNWPDEYRGHVFMCNLHGNRLNQDILERHGSGYVAHHGADFLFANDTWFRGITLLYGPDGGVFVSDWHDTGECHNYDAVRPCGRIFKVTYGTPPQVNVDLAKLSDEELVRLQLHKNEWYVRHARRLLQERAAAGKLSDVVGPRLRKLFAEETDVRQRLRLLWTLHVIGDITYKTVLRVADDREEDVRGWAVRLLVEDEGWQPEEVVAKLAELARNDRSASVRLALASALQRLAPLQRLQVARALIAHAEDATDRDLPLMVWYGVEPLLELVPTLAPRELLEARIPLVRQYVARRLVSSRGAAIWLLYDRLAQIEDVPSRRQELRDLLRGMYDSLHGQTGLSGPPEWYDTLRRLSHSSDHEVGEKALLLSVLYGDREAVATLRKAATDTRTVAESRQTALQTLVEAKAPDLQPLLRDLLGDPVMRGPALRALAAQGDPGTPALILQHYPSFTDAEKADAVATLASRPAYASAMLDAMERGVVARRDLSAFTARQLLGFKDKGLTEKLTRVWGSIRPPAQDKAALMNRYLSLVAPAALEKADRVHGRQLFARTCANCHTLFGEGGKIGPDLTGSQRINPEYLLSKLLDPNAVVNRDYQVTVINTTGGRTLNGIVKAEDDKTVTLQTPNEVVRVPKADIDERQRSPVSLMPEGQLTPLSDTEVRDLVGYLAGPTQVPLPPQPGK
jgi:putative membrane-bound dehydrogenase-like protein